MSLESNEVHISVPCPSEEHKFPSKRAEQIARIGSYEEILEQLQQTEALSNECARVKEQYSRELFAETWMTEGDWEMLAVMNYYDSKIAEHCVGTLLIAREKLQQLSLGEKKFVDIIEEESGSLTEFYRACLFHDVGKCCIPYEILNNQYSDKDFASLLSEHAGRKNDELSLDSIEAKSHEHFTGDIKNTKDVEAFYAKLHPMRFVSAKYFLEPEMLSAFKTRFPSANTETATLADLIAYHEDESRRILLSLGHATAAEIAGSHHNYGNKELLFPISSKTVGITAKVEELLSLADMEQAFSSKRSYKETMSAPAVFRNMIFEAQHREIDETLTALWVEQGMRELRKQGMSLSSEEERILTECERFVATHKTLSA